MWRSECDICNKVTYKKEKGALEREGWVFWGDYACCPECAVKEENLDIIAERSMR